MNDIYSVPELYDAFHGDKSDDIPLILSQAKSAGWEVLELACGTGRLAIPLCEAGFQYTGLDLSESYIKLASQKLKSRNLTGTVQVADMRTFDLQKKFDFIFVGFNSFLHLLSDEDAIQCLTRVCDHLKPGGRFLMDIFVPNPELLFRDPDKLYPVKTFDHPFGGKCQIREKSVYESENEILSVEWYFYRDGEDKPDPYDFKMRILFPDTVERLITESGLTILEKLGNYNGDPLTPESPLQISVCSL